MNKTLFLTTTAMLFTITSSFMCMKEQPRTPRKPANSDAPIHEFVELVDAINTGNFSKAHRLMTLAMPSLPIAIAYRELMQQEIQPNNPFYSKTNLQQAFVEPLDRNQLHLFVVSSVSISKSLKKYEKSPETQKYFKDAEDRLFDQ